MNIFWGHKSSFLFSQILQLHAVLSILNIFKFLYSVYTLWLLMLLLADLYSAEHEYIWGGAQIIICIQSDFAAAHIFHLY